MTIKEKVIRQSIKIATKQINEIDSILFANPLSDIIQLEKETILKVKELHNESNQQEAMILLNKAIKKREGLLKIAKKQQNSIKLIDDKVKLEFELADLNRDLYYIDLKRT